MLQKFKKGIAVICALALMITMLPVSANAAATPAFVKTYKSLYENSTNNGVYTYKVKNLTKGQVVKWSLSGSGKSYATLTRDRSRVSATTASNKLTIKTNGEIAAKNKTVKVIARVYSSSGKLLHTLSAGNAKIKVKPDGIAIQSSQQSGKLLQIGKSYQFNYKITPANATSSNVWSVTDQYNNDMSSYITKAGVFTPLTEGTFTITVQAKIGSSVYASATETVSVGTALQSVEQIAADQIKVIYSGDARKLVTKDSFSMTNETGARILIKGIAFSADGTEVTITTRSTFRDAAQYQLTDKITTTSFIARVSLPVRMTIKTTEATVGKPTTIDYALYDVNGIDVTAAYPGHITYSNKNIMNGYLLEDTNQIYMTGINDVGTFILVYTCNADSRLVLTDTAQIKCIAPSTSSQVNFTLTSSSQTPDYTAANYQDNRSVASGRSYYIHFRALDTDGGVLKYNTVTYESLDPDTLLINNSANGIAKATAIKSGTVTVLVTATYGTQSHSYEYDVTISEPAYPASLHLDRNTLTMSNRYAAGYKEYIKVSAYDQYGNPFALTNESAQISENSSYKAGLASYDAASNQIVIDAANKLIGTYSYTLTLTIGGHKVSDRFTITVTAPPTNGTVTYALSIDHPVQDLALTSDTTLQNAVSSKNITLRLAEYRDGIFNRYCDITSAKVMKNGQYYSLDLTRVPSSSIMEIGGGSEITLSTITLNNNVCTKASTGVYTVDLRFYPSNGYISSGLATISGQFELTDTQASPVVTVAHSTASAVCSNVVALASNCLSITGVPNATITDCKVTGSDTPGSTQSLASGEAVHIESVTIQVTTTLSDGKTIVSSYYVVNVGKTLRNA